MGIRHRPSTGPLQNVFLAGFFALTAACSVYDADDPRSAARAGAAGAGAGGAGRGGASVAGAGGEAGDGGTAGAGGEVGDPDGSTSDAATVDADATLADMASPYPDVQSDRALDAPGPESRGDVVSDSLSTPDTVGDVSDASTGVDASDATLPPQDSSVDASSPPDADAAPPDADAGYVDANDGASTGVQILPRHGTPIVKPDAGAPFDSRCASDEVVTGFTARAGVQTDAIGSTCSKLIGGVLSSPRNLPLIGNVTGGNAVTVTCPANHVAVGIVGRFGHNTMWDEDVTTSIGVVCKNLGSTATQIASITSQPALDPGYTSFREDCTGGRYLTDISGQPDSNSLAYTIGQVGGECSVR